jgi:cell division septal protein FtsQ
MSERHPYVGVRGLHNKQPASKRERAARNRSARARQHLENVRGGKTPIPVPSLSRVAPIAIAASIVAGALFGSGLLTAVGSWITGEPIRLESISVIGAARLSLTEVGEATALPKGVLISEIETHEVEDQLRTHPWISNASVVQIPASRLLIGITERVARAVIATDAHSKGKKSRASDETEWRVVSATGLPFARASASDIESLPRLVTRSAPATAQPNDSLAAAIEFAERFDAFDLPTPSEIVIDEGVGSEGWVIRLPSLAPRVLLGRENLDERLAALAELLNTVRAELAEADAIDLRFAEQAVLRRSQSPKGTTQASTSHGSVSWSKPRPTG